jgi:hypothetical protein
MMQTNKTVSEIYNALPLDVQTAMSSVDTIGKMQSIGQKHELHIDQIGELGKETGLVMLGLTHPSAYVKNLTERLNLDRGKATEIARDVNEQIFKPIRESLKRIHSMEGDSSENASLPPDSPLETSSIMQDDDLARLEARREEMIKKETSTKESVLAGASEIKTSSTEDIDDMSIHEQKLSGPTSSSSQRMEMGDPYREPIDDKDLTLPRR